MWHRLWSLWTAGDALSQMGLTAGQCKYYMSHFTPSALTLLPAWQEVAIRQSIFSSKVFTYWWSDMKGLSWISGDGTPRNVHPEEISRPQESLCSERCNGNVFSVENALHYCISSCRPVTSVDRMCPYLRSKSDGLKFSWVN